MSNVKKSKICQERLNYMSCVKRCQMSKSQTPVYLCMWHKCVCVVKLCIYGLNECVCGQCVNVCVQIVCVWSKCVCGLSVCVV